MSQTDRGVDFGHLSFVQYLLTSVKQQLLPARNRNRRDINMGGRRDSTLLTSTGKRENKDRDQPSRESC